MEKNILLTVEYDGSRFHGWQEQPGVRTVQGELQRALSRVIGCETKVAGTSRTDAGVHALGQCCSFRTETGMPTERFPLAVNNVLAAGRNGVSPKVPDVRVISAEEMPCGFHARSSCKGKMYRYIISLGEPDVFRRSYRYFVKGGLDIDAMSAAARYIVGMHDFAAFQSSGGTPRKTTVRTIFSADVINSGSDVVIEIAGDGFLYNMVRIIAGTLVETGQGRRSPEDMAVTIASRERSFAGHTAPPEGLYLAKIWFNGDAHAVKRKVT